MSRITMPAAVITAALLGFTLSACQNETPAQKEVKKQAEAIDDSYQAEADVVESLAEGAPKTEQKAAEAQADQLRSTGEQIKDDLKKEAKELPKP